MWPNFQKHMPEMASNRYNIIFIDDMITATTIHKNDETNDKFYRKVAFLMYTEMVHFTPQS